MQHTAHNAALFCQLQVIWGESSTDLPYMWESMADSERPTQFELGDEGGLRNFQVTYACGLLLRYHTDVKCCQ
jgi:hypothetical protein